MAAAALIGCDNSQAVHPPDPDLNRMLVQPRAESFDPSDLFEDGKVMQAPPKGTVPNDRPDPAEPPRDARLLGEGRRLFETICATCHGVDGSGESVVATKMAFRRPPSFDDPRLRALSDGDIYRIMSTGYGFMPSYAFMMSPRDRWAVVAYVDALRLSLRAPLAALPPEVRRRFQEEVP